MYIHILIALTVLSDIYIYALLHVTHAKAISGVLHNIEPESSMCKVL